MFVLHWTCGGVVSTTVTVKAHVVETPALVAVQTTLLVPTRKPVPEGGTHVTGTALPRASLAVATKVTGVRPPVHSATMFPGQLSSGPQSMLMTNVCGSDVSSPPKFVPPLSIATTVTVAMPQALIAGV